ncbi:MAG: DUF4097 family beta strand repeat protein [Treponema sp.]|nr:DUF4097 family beta strand repeat protein [Treponema sp.]
MNKKIFMIILTCVTIACIIIGAASHLRFAARPSVGRTVSRAIKNGFKSVTSDEYDYDFDEDLDDDFDIEIEATSGKNAFTNELQAFDSVKIDAHVMGVSIERGNRFEISGSYTKAGLKPGITVSGGTLKINQPDYKSKLVTNGNCKIVITVPFGTQLEAINLDIDVGAVELSGIDVQNINANTDVGAIAIKNVEFHQLKANSDVGAISVELTQAINEYNIDARSDVGAIQVNGANAKRRYSQQGNTSKTIKIKTDVGGIEIK